jgi:glutathione S-transferase
MENRVVTGFKWAPPFAQGIVRDLRVRWALEEAGIAYSVHLLDVGDRHGAAYLKKHPFGMVPAFEADGRELFESGAILHSIAEGSESLMPTDRDGRADTLTWMFAALNTVEPPLNNLSVMDLQHSEAEWAKLRRPAVIDEVNLRLSQLSAWLATRDYLADRFTVADILMITVLRLIKHTDLVARIPVLDAYVKRCEARPAFKKTLNDQLSEYARNAPVAA